MSAESSVVGRARVHAALGDPSRLRIVERLVLGDLSPGELTEDLRLPSNLLAHHLNVLAEAGLVQRVRSEGDRRRSYVRLIPGPLAQLLPVGRLPAPRVVFVCTHNSARSQLAAAAWRKASRIAATSAGTHPADRVHPRAVAVGRRHRLRVPVRRTAHLDDVLRPDDLVVAVCDSAHEELDQQAPARLHWSIPDPVRIGTEAAFERAFDLIQDRVERLSTVVRSP